MLEKIERHVDREEDYFHVLIEIRGKVRELDEKLCAHLQEAGPVLDAAKQLQALAGAFRVVWRVFVAGIGIVAMLWALAHFDTQAIARALTIMKAAP